MFRNIKKLFLFIIIASFVLFFFYQRLFKNVALKVNSGQFSIAIIVPASHPALEEIETGFIQTLERKGLSFSYDVYNGNGDRMLLRNQVESAVAKNYDLIFTIATMPALLVKQVCDQRKSNVAVVAGAVDDPVGIQLVQSMERSNNNITAVTSVDRFDLQLDLLKYLMPTVQKILLVYCPSAGLDKNCLQIQRIARDLNLQLQVLSVFNTADLMQKPQAFINNCDVVLILKDNMVVSGIESLIQLCNKAGKPLYASDLNSGDKGAALSFGVYEYQDGVLCAEKAYAILHDKMLPTDIASSATQDFKIKINTAAAEIQNLEISKFQLFLMKSGEVV